MKFIARPNRPRPAQIIETDTENAACWFEFAIDEETHGQAGGVPAACGQTLKRRFARRVFVEMIRLRIELLRVGDDLFFVDTQPAGSEGLAGGVILQIAYGHYPRAPAMGLSNHAPAQTATAL